MKRISLSIHLLLIILGITSTDLCAQERPLPEILTELSQQYQVYFSYDDALLTEQKADFQVTPNETVESALTRLLAKSSLAFELFDEKYVVLYQKNSPMIGNALKPVNLAAPKPKRKGKVLFSTLLDLDAGLPVENAFIFIRNTSVSTTSDETGFFEIDLGDFSRGELVITHLNYKTFSIPLSSVKQLEETIFLSPKQLSIATVNVHAKRANSKKRKKWLKQFKKDFFGTGRNRKGMELLNPEVVWFQEKEGELIAEAVDYLSIYNASLGYKLRFYLEEFRTDKRDQVRYVGKVFFEDVSNEAKRVNRINRNRKRTYQRSKKAFFRSLLADELDPDQFHFGEAILDDNRKVIYFNPLTRDSLTILKGVFQDTLLTANFFAFVNKKMVSKWGRSASGMNNFASCFLFAEQGRIILDHSGEILNPKEIIEVGHWTTSRLANLMPMEYNFVRPSMDEKLPDDVIGNLALQVVQNPQEKVYLHLNKPYFSITESIWFRTYLLNAHTHQSNTLSKVVHVDLVDPEGQITHSWNLHRDKVMDGDFRFNSTHKSGLYHLRAYTQYMRNTDANYFFQKSFMVYDPSENQLETNKDSLEMPSIVNLTFFPEGGEAVEGLSANMAFKMSDENGNSLNLSGEILDDLNRLVTKIKPSHAGLGLFNYIPEKDRTYRAVLQNDFRSYEFPLPPAQSEGLVMRINNRSEDKIFIEIEGSHLDKLEGAFLVGHVRGQLVCFLEDLSEESAIVMDKNTFPTGVVHFTLFDKNNKPLAERLIFNEFGLDQALLSVKDDENSYSLREKITLHLDTLLTEELWKNATLSLSVTDQSVVRYDDYAENINSYLWLNSDLPNPIPNPNYYLQYIDKSKRFWLDLWLMTHGWRRFKWDSLATSLKKPLAYLPETGYGLQGYTTEKGNPSKRMATQVLLTALDKEFIYESQSTDEQGNFYFQNLPYLDSITFIIQARERTKNNMLDVVAEELKMRGNRMVDFHFIQQEAPPIDSLRYQLTNQLESNLLEKYLKYESHSKTLDSIYNSIWEIDFAGEIVVRGKRKRPFRYGNVYDLDYADWIPPNKAGTYLLSALFARANFEINPTEAKMYHIRGRVKRPVSISINGTGGDREGSNPYRFLSLPADRIKYINFDARGPSVSVITRAIPRSLQIKLESGILHYDHPGYARAREFYAPDYAKNLPIHREPDLRTAIHWEPQLKVTKGKTTTVSFYAADTPTRYEYRLEGVTDTGKPVFDKGTIEITSRDN